MRVGIDVSWYERITHIYTVVAEGNSQLSAGVLVTVTCYRLKGYFPDQLHYTYTGV